MTENVPVVPELDEELVSELIYSNVGDVSDGWKVRHKEDGDHLRWVSMHSIVIEEVSTGQCWWINYQQGLTEYQDCDRFFGDKPELRQVWAHKRMVEVTDWLTVA